jgi:hypothetical protein
MLLLLVQRCQECHDSMKLSAHASRAVVQSCIDVGKAVRHVLML